MLSCVGASLSGPLPAPKKIRVASGSTQSENEPQDKVSFKLDGASLRIMF